MFSAALLRCAAFVSCCLLTCAPLRAERFDDDYKQTLNGTTLHFRVRGVDKSNPYLILLHGGPGFSAHMFYGWGRTLEQRLNVVYLDQRGSGESTRYKFAQPFAPTSKEAGDYTIANLVKDIESVREFLKVDRWYVLGHSWGGMLGLEYVAAHPEHVLGYIHMDGLISMPLMQQSILETAEAKFQKEAQSGDAPRKAEAETQLKTIAQLRAQPQDSPTRVMGLLAMASGPAQLYFAKDQATAFVAFTGKIREATKPYNVPDSSLTFAVEPMAALILNDHFLTREDRPLLAKITSPTLIINGKQDGLITPSMAELAHKGIAKSQILLLDKCGHFPFAEQPEKTTAAILAFVKAHS